MSDNRIRRILCIDGGGIKGVMPAAYLAYIEDKLKIRIADHFDLIAGTSTGGIIALGLGLHIPAAEILDLYKSKGPAIFSQDVPVGFQTGNWIRLNTKGLFFGKYNSTRLHAELENIFGTKKLGHSHARLVIPAYSDSPPGPHLFKTAHHARLRNDYLQSAVDVALATSAAPTYFPKHQLATGEELVDGGVWANNPIGVAALEAACMLGWDMHNVHILSLGCTSTITTYPRHGGLLSFGGGKIVKLLLDGQSHISMATAKLLLGGPESQGRIIRQEVPLEKDYFKLDDTRKILSLEGLSRKCVRVALPQLEKVFFSAPADPFNPMYKVPENELDKAVA
ncbi:MAG: patatin [Alphaproteobacteria bacterium PRO2]|nr:patatin [Alphaproteobacteria bacterium PRO2]